MKLSDGQVSGRVHVGVRFRDDLRWLDLLRVDVPRRIARRSRAGQRALLDPPLAEDDPAARSSRPRSRDHR